MTTKKDHAPKAKAAQPDEPSVHTAADDIGEQRARESWDVGPSQHVDPLPDEVPVPVNREQLDADGMPYNPVRGAAKPYDVSKDKEAKAAAELADDATPLG
jgi:hypothetical protein